MTGRLDIESRLREERPTPSPGFRGDLSRRLARGDRGHPGRISPRALVLSYLGTGVLLLAVAAAGLGGAGPFAA